MTSNVTGRHQGAKW